MIFAGLTLLAIGATDLVRQFVPATRRWIGFVVIGVVVVAIGGFGDAQLPAAAAVVLAAAWLWSMPSERPLRAGFWPAVLLAAVVVVAVVWGGARVDAGLLGTIWRLESPGGSVPLDVAVLAAGVVLFLLESGNLIVRAALDSERTGPGTVDGAEPDAVGAVDPVEVAELPPGAVEAAELPPGAEAEASAGFKGGRLIGPLERVIVFLLTLAAAYPLLAAMLAAKGIVRFPEISRDGQTGSRAEYFLIGSLVSWVIALSGAFLLWWAVQA